MLRSIAPMMLRPCAGILLVVVVLTFSTAQESADRDAFRQLYEELRTVMDKDLDEAVVFVESKISEEPDSIDRNVLRQSLASRMLDQERYRDATDQFRKLLDFQIRRIETPENQLGVWLTLQSMREAASKEEFATAVQQSFDALIGVRVDDSMQILFPLSQLSVMKAQVLAGDGKDAEARQLVTTQVQHLIEVNRSEQASEETAQTLISMLRSLTTEEPTNDLWRKECVEYLDTSTKGAIEKYPASIAIQNVFAETQWRMITQWQQDDPEANKERIELVSKQLNPLALRNRSLQAILRRIQAYQQRMEAAKPAESLVGKPVPKWEIDAWVNTPDTSQDAFAGKVVLIDFWAMWCGPCIATFPHLREWREEFGEQGFEIVGVTQYYNFVWDDLNQRASRSEDPVDAVDERETLAKFLEHHQLSHPVFVTPKESEMGSEFGVRGIPHVVLVDRDGIVQLIKTGAGEQTAKEIHDKIKELVAVPGKPNP